MRLFFAVEIADHVRAAAAATVRALRAGLERGGSFRARWIPEEHLHVTLWFLGEVPDPQVPAITAAVEAPLPVAPFDLEVGGLGTFPPSGPPRVIWMAVGAGPLGAVHDEVARRLRPLGFEPERRAFNPHLTLARVRDRPARQARTTLRRLVRDVPARAGSSPVRAVTLFRSRLSPGGSRYETVVRVPLGG